MENLKPCPFCGYPAEIEHGFVHHIGKDGIRHHKTGRQMLYAISCTNRECMLGNRRLLFKFSKGGKDLAVRRWNRRKNEE